jgi:tetratricopeptide (TPR) repeat protein
VVGEALAGRGGEIKQATIGCEVFGRPASYDPKQDAVVRSVARVVREKLNDYYLTAGASNPVRIEIPKGTYTPCFSQLPAPGQVAPVSEASAPPRRRVLAAAACILIAAAAYSIANIRSRPLPPKGDPAALDRAGRARYLAGDFTGARPLLERAAELSPRDALIHAALADDLAALGYDAKALEEARKAVAASADLSPSGELQVEAVFRSLSGDHPGAVEALLALIGMDGQRPEYIRGLAREQLAATNLQDCVRTAARRTAADPQLAVIESYCRAGQGDFSGALEPVRRAVTAAKASGQREVYARARLLEAGLLMSTGRIDESAAPREEARRICSAIHDDTCTIRALRIRANLDAAQGRPAPALAAYRAALALAEKVGSSKEIAELQDGEGWALMQMDDPAGAHAAFLESMMTGRRAGFRSAMILQDLATLALRQGDFHRTVVLAEQSIDEARGIGDRVTEAAAGILKARALFERGDLTASERLLDDVRQAMLRYHLSADIPRQWRLAHANLSRALGKLDAAQRDLDARADFTYAATDPDYQVARLQLLLSQRRYDDAARAAHDMLAFLDGSGNQSATALVTALLSDAYGGSGRLVEAREKALAARAMLSDRTAPTSNAAVQAAADRWAAPSLESNASPIH